MTTGSGCFPWYQCLILLAFDGSVKHHSCFFSGNDRYKYIQSPFACWSGFLELKKNQEPEEMM
ncbi:Protein of unknown function [Gryllus bimaculatus]|nr:Protein of unknown function [Gryllus bimaculatus]